MLSYALTVLIETPILLIGLSARHSLARRLFAGVWLNACSYPIVWLVLPTLIDANDSRAVYLAVAETFAPVSECALFWLAFGQRDQWGRWSMWRDLCTIVLANLASFGAGVVLHSFVGYPL